MRKKIFAVVLALSLIIMCLPQIMFAADADTATLDIANGDITVDASGYTQNGVKTEHAGGYILTGTGSYKVNITGGTHTIILRDLNMTGAYSYGIQIGGNSNVEFVISGKNNTITRGGIGGDYVPIGVKAGSSVSFKGETAVDSENVLNAIGTSDGKAAIGAAWDQYTCGNINIISGTINATGGGNKASVIGSGGNKTSSSEINISGGIVNCTWASSHNLPDYMIGGSNITVTVSGTARVAGTNLSLGGKLYKGYDKNPLFSITAPDAVTGIASGTEKTAEALGLPDTVKISTDDPNVSTAEVYWDLDNLASGSYDPSVTTQQTFTVKGTVTLPEKVDNMLGLSLEVTVQVTVSACSFDKNGFCTDKDCGNYEPAVYNGEAGVYEISNAGQLMWFADYVNSGDGSADAELKNDIDLYGADFNPIGTTDVLYRGNFDGNGHSIKNMVINNSKEYQGLFGAVGGGAVISGVIIDKTCSVTAGDYSAALVGGSNGKGKVTITNCGNEADVTAGINAAGIFGVNMMSYADLIITDCYNTGNITASKEGGSISGWSDSGTVTNCWNSGTVTGESSDSFARGGDFVNCYNLDTLPESDNKISTFAAEELESGMLCWKLNGKRTERGSVWKQTIGEDGYPAFDGELVYPSGICVGAGYGFVNTETVPDEYHLVDTSDSHTQITGSELTVSADVQNENGESTDKEISYQWYLKEDIPTVEPEYVDNPDSLEESDGIYTSTDPFFMLVATYNLTGDGQTVGFEYLLPQSDDMHLRYEFYGYSAGYDWVYGEIDASDADGTWQKLVFEDLPQGEYRLMIHFDAFMNESPVSLKLQTNYEYYSLIDGADQKTFTIPATNENGLYQYAVKAAYGGSEEIVDVQVAVTGPVYYVTIPEYAAAGDSFTVSADAELIEDSKEVTVTLGGTGGENNEFTLKNETGEKLYYKVEKDETALNTGDTVLTVKNGETASAQITVQPDKPKFSGTYTGTLTFSVSLEDIT